MNAEADLDIFLATLPGLEALLSAEAAEKGFREPAAVPGGVTITGDWPEVWRANLELRGATRVLVRVGAFRALHLAQLDKRARRLPWGDFLRPDVPVRIEATCKKSRLYHSGAVAQRIGRAIREELGAPVAAEAVVEVMARLHDDLCTVSIDTSGEMLHRRGHKEAVAKAPLRETMAALFLRHCGFDGREPLVDPMCGSGTFVIEAAEIAAGLRPGRSRAFAFEHLAGFDAAAWRDLRGDERPVTGPVRFFGFDRDGGAIRMSQANAERAGVNAATQFRQQSIGDLVPPEGPPGLVVVNPPYGERIGEERNLHGLYHALGQVLLGRFSGWRAGLVTSSESLAGATGLPFAATSAPVSHGGLRVKVYATAPLP